MTRRLQATTLVRSNRRTIWGVFFVLPAEPTKTCRNGRHHMGGEQEYETAYIREARCRFGPDGRHRPQPYRCGAGGGQGHRLSDPGSRSAVLALPVEGRRECGEGRRLRLP